jgi:dTDP-4-amino-4,6-dideoxygalactose transaminase
MLDVARQNGPLRSKINAAIAEVIDSGAFVHGPACGQLETAFAEFCRTKYAVGCASGSDALLLALIALGIGSGHEVILPSFTFFATAGAVARLGARPVFADILPSTFNLDPVDVERKITRATKAIIPVHLFGQSADMRRLNEVAVAAGNLPIIEDAAQAIGAEQYGGRVGSLGTLGAFSFYPTKNLGGFGDGGMITTNDATLADKLKILRDHGQQPRYHHWLVGLNSRLDTIQAAVLRVKLPMISNWTEQRTQNAAHYTVNIRRLGLAQRIATPQVVMGCRPVWNQYTVRVRDGQRDAIQQFLASRDIGSAIYYPIPLHLQKCFASLGYSAGSLPHTEQACREVLSLPIFPELTTAEQDRAIAALAEYFDAEAESEGNSRAA